jgi:hypothetical protein
VVLPCLDDQKSYNVTDFFSNSSGVNIQISTVFDFSREILFYFKLFSLDENRHMIEKKPTCFYKN